MQQKQFWLWLLASPVLLVTGSLKLIRHLRFLHLATKPAVLCRTCGTEISLVGFWRCACSYCYNGHLLRICPLCGTLPRLIRCYQCGATQLLRGR
jgi:hypothetical protein